ncbi:hypothetical protein GF337_11905 [candidate division KSB1 bacterium]|nr:hypothetical protein [candidate division KSB1 bacterium]
MKKIITITFILMTITISNAQDVNWKSVDPGQRSLGHFQFGYDYGVTVQLGYSRFANIYKPVLFTLDYSFPMGEKLFDDFTLRYGGQVEIYKINNISVTGKILGNFRRYQTSMVRIASFGADFSVLAGFYKSSWHIAGELGFDKAISSHLKHSEEYRNNVWAEIKDGWYVPTGGNWYYGIQGSKTIGGTYDITLRAGATNAQGNDEDSMLPFYFQLGLNKKF